MTLRNKGALSSLSLLEYTRPPNPPKGAWASTADASEALLRHIDRGMGETSHRPLQT